MRGGGITRQKTPNPIRLLETLDPSATPDTGYTYTNDVAGRTELMYMDDTGAEIQITKAGVLNAAAMGFPLLAPDGLVGAPSYSFSSSPTTGLYMGSAGSPYMVTGGTAAMRWLASAAGVVLVAGGGLVFSSSGVSATSGAAVFLQRDGNGVLSQRDSTNAQTFTVHNTYTAGTPDYERLELLWSANVCYIRTAKNGTGVSRGLGFPVSNSTSQAISIPTTTNGAVIVNNYAASAVFSSGILNIGGNGAHTATSGTGYGVLDARSFSDGGTTSTTVQIGIGLTPTINYTAASKTGKVVLAYLNPTLTSQPSGTNAGLSFGSALNSTTFPATIWNNVADEDTNYERMEASFGVALTNSFCFRVTKGGSGTLRTISFLFAGTSTQALVIPNGIGNTMDVYTGSPGGTVNGSGYVRFGGATGGGNCTATSGTSVGANFTFSPAPTATSTMAYSVIQVNPTINYSNGTPGAGKVNLVYLNPVLTAQPTGSNGGIVFSSAFTSSTFPAMRFNNLADEDTNPEFFEMGWHVSSNNFVLRTNKLGSGTVRPYHLFYPASTAGAVSIPTTTAGTIAIANIGSTGGVSVARVSLATTSCSSAAGTDIGVSITTSWAPSSTSTMIGRALSITPTINYSNGTPGAGSAYLLYLNPINTALPTGLNAGIALAATASALTGGILWHNQTDEATNYEYVYEKFTSNVWEIGSVKGGTGTLRGLRFGITGNSIGFYGVTPVARPAAYTLTATVVTSRTLLASASATAVNCNNVLAQVIQDLQAVGLLQ